MAVINKNQVKNGEVIRSEYYTLGRGVVTTAEKNKRERLMFMSYMCLRNQCVYDVLAHKTCKHCKYRFP